MSDDVITDGSRKYYVVHFSASQCCLTDVYAKKTKHMSVGGLSRVTACAFGFQPFGTFCAGEDILL